MKEQFKVTKNLEKFSISCNDLEMLMRPSKRKKSNLRDSMHSKNCLLLKRPNSMKPEKVFLLKDSMLNLQLLKVNSMALKKLGKQLRQLRMSMTLKRLDLEKSDLIWIMIKLRPKERRTKLTKISKRMRIPSKESTKPRKTLGMLRTQRESKSLLLLLKEKNLLTKS